MKQVLSKLFKTWITIVCTVSIAGFIISTAMTVHDSYVAYKALVNVSQTFPSIDPKGETLEQLDKLKESMFTFTVRTKEEKFIAGCSYGATVFDKIRNRENLKKLCQKIFPKVETKPWDDMVTFGCGFGMGAALKDLGRESEIKHGISQSDLNVCIKNSMSSLDSDSFNEELDFINSNPRLRFEEYGIYVVGLWGDHDMSNVEYLATCSLWIVVGSLVVAVSLGVKRWVKWLTNH